MKTVFKTSDQSDAGVFSPEIPTVENCNNIQLESVEFPILVGNHQLFFLIIPFTKSLTKLTSQRVLETVDYKGVQQDTSVQSDFPQHEGEEEEGPTVVGNVKGRSTSDIERQELVLKEPLQYLELTRGV